MRLIFTVLNLAFVGFFNSIESISPIRTREHTNTAEEPSTSGNNHSHILIPYGLLRQSQNDPNFRHEPIVPYFEIEYIPGLYMLKNDRLVPFDNSIGAKRAGYLIGQIVDGYIRPVYNKRGQIVVVRENDRRRFLVTLEQAERFGVNQPVPNVLASRNLAATNGEHATLN